MGIMKMKDLIKAFLGNVWVRLGVFIITILGVVFSLYTGLSYRNPELEYEIISRTTIFDKNERISQLRILIDSLDVQQNNTNISIFTIKVVNNGQNIAPVLYDGGDFGIIVNNGYIIEEPTVVEAATPHIQKRLKDKVFSQDSTFINMPNIALDTKDYYIIKFGMIHHNDSIPNITSIGKIVGQKHINIKYIEDQEKYYITAFKGRWLVQLLRLLSYGIFSICCIFAIIILWIIISESNSKYNKRMKQLLKDIEKENINIHPVVKDDFIKDGQYFIFHLYSLLSDIELLNIKYPQVLALMMSDKDFRQLINGRRSDDVDKLIERKYIIANNDGGIEINVEMKQSVDFLYDFLIKNSD